MTDRHLVEVVEALRLKHHQESYCLSAVEKAEGVAYGACVDTGIAAPRLDSKNQEDAAPAAFRVLEKRS